MSKLLKSLSNLENQNFETILDTIVVPAREDGFTKEFIGNNCWYAVKIQSSKIKQIKYIAAYQIVPISAITHIAKVKSIEPYLDTDKYIIKFAAKATKIKPIKLVLNGKTLAPQNIRYTSYLKLIKAKNLDMVF